MRAAGIAGVSRRRGPRTTRRDVQARPAPDRVERHFEADAPNRLWVADITYVPTLVGFLYLAIVLDVFSRRVVGWSMATHLRTELVVEALEMAVEQRRPEAVVHHSDQGCQYTSLAFGGRCREWGVELETLGGNGGQELRDLTRTRKQLVAEIARHTQRLQKTLEDANVKLTRVVTDILGASGRAIIAALIAGETDPERLADCTTGRLKAGRADIVAAVHGRVTAHHRFLLELHSAQIDALRATVQKVERQADEVLRPFREAADRLTTIPGVSETVARVIIAEVGTDMTQFPSAGHLVSWAGLCPRLDESAGKRRSTRIRHATPWLKTALVQAAWAATRKKDSYLQSQFRRIKGRRGPKKAIIAVAASMLTAVYFMLRDEKDYHDLGGRYLAGRDKERAKQRLLRRLHDLGVVVEVKAA